MLICQVATQGERTLITFYDEYNEDPRQEWDNFGKMICWHRRYNLGDNHQFDDPDDFLSAILVELDIGKTLFNMVKQGKHKNLRLTYDSSRREWLLESYGDFSGQWYEEEAYASGLSEKNLPDFFADDVLKHLTISEMMGILDIRHDFVILPLYLYDHSGITMSVSSFSCPWDSGQVGWIYANRKMIEDEFGVVNTETIEKTRLRLISEVETYDLHLTGQCYGFACYDGETEIENLGGYLGEYQHFVRDLPSDLPKDFRPIVDDLTDCNVSDIANYLWRLRHAI